VKLPIRAAISVHYIALTLCVPVLLSASTPLTILSHLTLTCYLIQLHQSDSFLKTKYTSYTTDLLQLVTTTKDYVLNVLHTAQIILGLLSLLHSSLAVAWWRLSKADDSLPLGSQTVTFSTSRCLIAASNGGNPFPLDSQIVPGLSHQLLRGTVHNWTLDVRVGGVLDVI
jgi:hypothetical protein